MFEDSLLNIAFAIVRTGAFVANAFLLGLPVVLLMVVRPSLRQGPGELPTRARRQFGERLEGLVQASLWASAIGSLIAIVLQGIVFADLGGGRFGGDSIMDVLDSSFGKWYLLRLPVLAALGILLVGKVRRLSLNDEVSPRPGPMWWYTWIALAVGLVATSSFSGHASVSSPLGLALLNDIVHLVSGSVWFGGVVVLAVAVPDVRRSLDPVQRTLFLAPLVVRFSSVALVAIGLSAVTGTFNSLFNLETPSDLVDTGYGGLLAAKILVFLGVIALGAINHFFVRRRLQQAAEKRSPDTINRVFKRTIAAELVMALLIFGMTGVLVGSTRPRPSAASPTVGISERV